MSQNRFWSHEIALGCDAVSVAEARRFVASHLVQHRLQHLVQDVPLVASELAANAVRHAQTPFIVTLARVDPSVVLSVRDGSSSAPVHLHPAPLDRGGRGVFIVDALSQDWGVDAAPGGGKSVWVTFPIRR